MVLSAEAKVGENSLRAYALVFLTGLGCLVGGRLAWLSSSARGHNRRLLQRPHSDLPLEEYMRDGANSLEGIVLVDKQGEAESAQAPIVRVWSLADPILPVVEAEALAAVGGRFTFTDLAYGPKAIQVLAAGVGETLHGPVSLIDGYGLQDAAIQVQKVDDCPVQLLDGFGNPLVGEPVRLIARGMERSSTDTVSDDLGLVLIPSQMIGARTGPIAVIGTPPVVADLGELPGIIAVERREVALPYPFGSGQIRISYLYRDFPGLPGWTDQSEAREGLIRIKDLPAADLMAVIEGGRTRAYASMPILGQPCVYEECGILIQIAPLNAIRDLGFRWPNARAFSKEGWQKEWESPFALGPVLAEGAESADSRWIPAPPFGSFAYSVGSARHFVHIDPVSPNIELRKLARQTIRTPVAHSTVYLDGPRFEAIAVADKFGEASVYLPRGEHLVARCTTFGGEQSYPEGVCSDADRPVTLQRRKRNKDSRCIMGFVSSKGRHSSRVDVLLQGAQRFPQSSTTDEHGFFRFDDVGVSYYELLVRPREDDCTSVWAPFIVPHGSPESDYDNVMLEISLRDTSVVIESKGMNAVNVYQASSIANVIPLQLREGTATLKNLAPGDYVVESPDGGEPLSRFTLGLRQSVRIQL